MRASRTDEASRRHHRRSDRQHPDRRLLARRVPAAAVAVRPRERRAGARGVRTGARSAPDAAARDSIRVPRAFAGPQRRYAGRLALQHDRRTHLQLLRPERRRLHRRRRLCVVAAGGRERLHRARSRRSRRRPGRRRRPEPRSVRARRLCASRRARARRDARLRSPRDRLLAG